MNDPVIIKAAACVPVDVLLCTLLVFLVLLLQVFTCLSDIWPRASSCWANAGTFAAVLIKKCFVCALCVSGYAHFIRGRQYWKFDPVNMNSLEGYPRYVGVDFFGCRNGRFWIWGSFWFFCNGVVSLLSVWFFGAKTFLSLEKDSKEMKASPLNLFIFHLLIHRSSTPSSQENQVVFPQTWHLLCSYTHIYFAHFCHSKAEFWALV